MLQPAISMHHLAFAGDPDTIADHFQDLSDLLRSVERKLPGVDHVMHPVRQARNLCDGVLERIANLWDGDKALLTVPDLTRIYHGVREAVVMASRNHSPGLTVTLQGHLAWVGGVFQSLGLDIPSVSNGFSRPAALESHRSMLYGLN